MTNTWEQLQAIYDRSVVLALTAVAHLVDERTHPDWLQDLTTEASQSEEAAVRGKTYVRRIWQTIGVASALVGLPADVIALAGAAGGLMSGH